MKDSGDSGKIQERFRRFRKDSGDSGFIIFPNSGVLLIGLKNKK
jgi:hypothetical protein